MKRWRAWLGVVLIFLLGAVCGFVLAIGVIQNKTRLLLRGGTAKVEDPIVTKLRSELRLDPAQQTGVRQIVVETRAEIEAIRKRNQPEIGAAMLAGEQKVRVLLRPDQAERFEKLLRESRDKWRPAG